MSSRALRGEQRGLLLTCKLSVGRAPASKLSHQLPVGLEDEDTAGLVVHGDDVSVLIHGHAFGTHEPTRTDLVLRGREGEDVFQEGKKDMKHSTNPKLSLYGFTFIVLCFI